MLDGTKTMRKQISIEIINDDPSGTKGLKVYQRKDKYTSRLIARGVDDGQLFEVLNDRQQEDFIVSGKWQFKVPAQSLCEVFQWLP